MVVEGTGAAFFSWLLSHGFTTVRKFVRGSAAEQALGECAWEAALYSAREQLNVQEQEPDPVAVRQLARVLINVFDDETIRTATDFSDAGTSLIEALRSEIATAFDRLNYLETGVQELDGETQASALNIDTDRVIDDFFHGLLVSMERRPDLDPLRSALTDGLHTNDLSRLQEKLEIVIEKVDQVDLRAVSADAVLRGPVKHLGVEGVLNQADMVCNEKPEAAAALYAEVAEVLESSPYSPHAYRVRQKQAETLRAAGYAAQAAQVDLDIMATALEAGDPFTALGSLRHLEGHEDLLPASIVRSANFLGAVAAYEHHHAPSLDEVATRFDESTEGDPYQLLGASLSAEHTIAGRRTDLVRERSENLRAVASIADDSRKDRLLCARLRACIADASGDWDALIRLARTEYPPPVTAMLLARHGRHLANIERSSAAVDRYYDAIERACNAHSYADAADWLFALRLVFQRFATHPGELKETFHDAQAVRAAGNDSVLPAPFSAREQALSKLQSKKAPDALEALHRFLWRAVVLGSWAEEAEAHEKLGQLYAETNHPMEALSHYIAAGLPKEIRDLTERFPERTVSLHASEDFAARPAWERAAALTAAGSAGDLLSDENAGQWAAIALNEMKHPASKGIFGPDPHVAAVEAFSELADAATTEEAQESLTLLDPLVEREPNRYRFTDEAHAKVLMRIASYHAGLRSAAVEQLCRALVADQRMGEIILSEGEWILRAEPSVVEQVCRPSAEDNHKRAAVALVVAEADTTPVVPLAHDRLEVLAQAPAHERGRRSFGRSWQEDALLMIALDMSERSRFADIMTSSILDDEDVSSNRREALYALATIAPTLDPAIRERHFPLALAAAKGEHDGSYDDRTPISTGGPLDRFRLSFGPTTLVYAGLFAASTLAHAAAQHSQVVLTARELIASATPGDLRVIAHALDRVDSTDALLDPLNLATHQSKRLRALAAKKWCDANGQPHDLGFKLASDESRTVRLTLASNVPKEKPDLEDVRAVIQNDVRRSVRRALEVPPSEA